MSAVQQVESHHGIAEGQQCLINRIVGRSTRERLHVDEDLVSGVTVGCESFSGAAAGEGFDCVGIFHAFVIARVAAATIMSKPCGVIENLFLGHPTRLFIGVAFSVNILESGSQRLAHSHRRSRFAGDEDQFSGLPLSFQLSQLENVRVKFG